MGEINKLDNVIENITTIAHTIILVYAVYILHLAITTEYDMTTLHIIFLALGVSHLKPLNIQLIIKLN